ncbi:hypothetical protein [Sinisalibacter aestuarii]|uniref:Hydrogenase assembly protein HupF n=1 Tax=Sinisalibacter aestuarii TaxID=2949426 RepID=A0ABQ5LX07_9RHOB|nr:hypothetical protein [Sinisalibacter aestuarii]GKY89498.1 hydrogenase assembly protein HupF [Sinisalibacter aestuarii]
MSTAQNGIGGEIRVRLGRDGEAIGAVEILSTRPRDAARIFVGMPVDRMCETIGRVFSLCGTAQSVAALRAAEAAQGLDSEPGVEAARDLARLAEMLTQTAMRLALHWPRVLGLEPRPEIVRACLAAERQIEAEALGPGWRRPGAGAAMPGAALAEALGALDTLIEAADPGAPLAEALAARGIEGYGALPGAMAPEAGAFARNWEAPRVAALREAHGAGLAARLAASRAELEDLPLQMLAALNRIAATPARSARRDTGDGMARVETARGPLTHRQRLSDGVVVACATEAPTEANFAPGGPVAAGLRGAPLDAVAAELHLLAIDPCVACSIELAER